MTVTRRYFGVWLGVLLMCGLAQAQTTQEEIASRLMYKGLYLRGFQAEDQLAFSAEGKPLGQYRTSTFTLCGVEVSAVQLLPDRLVLTGRRMGVRLDQAGEVRAALFTNGAFKKKFEEMTITIAGPADGDYDKALSAVFASSLAQLVPSLPEEWQIWAKQHLLPPGQQPKAVGLDPVRGPKFDNPRLTAPKVKFEPAADFEGLPEPRFGGRCLIYVVVGTDGNPHKVRVLRPVGMGVDERVLAAVREYRFVPAKQDGKAIEAEMQIEVNFQIY